MINGRSRMAIPESEPEADELLKFNPFTISFKCKTVTQSASLIRLSNLNHNDNGHEYLNLTQKRRY